MKTIPEKATHLSQYFEYPCYRLGWKDAKGIPLEERTDLTVTELDQLGVDDPYETRPTKNEYPTIAPNLVIEIVSVDDPFVYVLDNADLCLSKGSKLVWIVIPAKACVLVWTASEQRWEYQTLTCPELLPGWSLDLKKFFSTISEYEIVA